MSADLVNIIFGMKMRQARAAAGLSLAELAQRTGLSPSYLTEIERGRKYPRNDKILALAAALGKTYDDLVSIKLQPTLRHLETALSSSLLGRFPFAEFGFATEDLLNLLTREPEKASALLHAILEMARRYDLQEEEFLRAALRSYQEIHENYFPELEEAAQRFTAEFAAYGLSEEGPVALEALATLLQAEFGYALDEQKLAEQPELLAYRSVYLRERRLLLNPRLYPRQRKFLLARELGYQYLGLAERSATSPPDEVHSFQQLLNDYKAAYFGGALLIPRAALLADLEAFFDLPTWQPQALADMLARYDVTPEMLFYRFSELLPPYFGIRLHFLRFHQANGDLRLVRHLNLSQLPLPGGIGLQEHYCRRWLAARLLREMKAAQGQPSPPPGIHVATFLENGEQFVAIGFARSLVLSPGEHSSVTVGFRLTPEVQQRVRFLADPAIPQETVGETCERCPLPDCAVRAAPPVVLVAGQAKAKRQQALQQLEAAQRQG